MTGRFLPTVAGYALRSLLSRWTVGSLLLLWLIPDLWAQPKDIRFSHLSEEHGLASTSVYAFTQTPDGFLWIGTQNGLHRYDGYTFKVFDFMAGDTTSLSDNWVKALTTDAAGDLWIATSNGLNKFNRTTEKFTSFFADPKNPFTLADNNLWSLFRDSRGNLWAGTNTGLSRYDASHHRFISYRISTPNGPENIAVNTISEDKQGNLWVGTWGSGVFHFDQAKGVFTPFSAITAITSTERQYVKVLRFDSKGRLWIGTQGNGLHLYEPAAQRYTIYKTDPNNPDSISDNAILSIMEDSQKQVWIGTYSGGINQFTDGRFVRYQYDPLNPHSLHGTWITSLFEDKSGVIWAGHDDGLSKFDPKGPKFLLYQLNLFDKNSIPKSNINVIYEDRDGLIWFGLWGEGLCSFDPVNRKFIRYENDSSDPQSLADDRVWGIAEDAQGILWIATSRGLDKFNKKTGIFEHIRDIAGQPNVRASQLNTLSCIKPDRQGRLWVGTWGGGLYIYDPVRNAATHLKHHPEDPNSLSHNQIKHILIDSKEVVWISTSEGGLNRLTFNGQGQPVIKRYQYEARNDKSISSNSTRVTFEDRQKRLWVGTEGSGLSWFDPATETFHRVKSLGAASFLKSVFGILEDADGTLWLSTNRGIVHYFPASGHFKLYDIMDGLQSNTFLSGHYKTRNGMMLFGGHNGFNMFHPEQVKESRYVPPVLINELKLFNKTVEVGQTHEGREAEKPLLTKPLYLCSEIVLSYKDYVLSFGFTSLDYTAPQKNQYAYMLEGFEEKWNYTDASQRFATYTNLKPGEYLLKVKGSNSDGVWNQLPATIRVVVTPPWWQTWWAYLLYALTGIGILFLLKRYTERRERLKNELELKRVESEKLQEVDQIKTRFFTNISHEFRTPLTLILGPLEKKLSEIAPGAPEGNEFRMMHRNAHRLLQLINQLLDISKLEAGSVKLEPAQGDLLAFLKSMVFSFASLADSKGIKLEFRSPHASLWALFDRDKIEKIITNLLSNAFKFTPDGGMIRVKVHVVASDPAVENGLETVEITVEDTGAGIPAAEINKIFDRFFQVDGSTTREREGSGIGLALTRELVLLHKGDISVTSEVGAGTCFTLRLPVGLKQLANNKIHAEQTAEGVDVLPIAPGERLPRPDSEMFSTTDGPAPLLLIVEDNEEVRRYIHESFVDCCRVLEAGNGQDGLEKAVEAVPDIIITDLMMPRMDGMDLCKRLKTNACTSHIPIILLTAKSSIESRLDGLETGADDYLTKPFHPQELRLRVRNLVEGRRKLRERFTREVKLQPKDVAITSADEKFLQLAIEVVEKHMANVDFTVENLENEMALSKMQLYRKMKALIDQTPNEFIRNIRLKRAAVLISRRTGTISEISYEVGFNNQSYFAKCFKEMYGVTPSEYAAAEKDAVS